MISHKHKTIFVHVPKVAGISIEQMFLEDLGLNFENRMPLIIGTSTNKELGPPRVSHLLAEEYVSQHYVSQELFDQYFSFGFVRNPYKRVYSFYKYLGYNNLISFEKFVLKYLPLIMQDSKLYYFVQPMYNYLYVNDVLAVDKIGKLETISEDVNFIFENTSIPERVLPHANKSESLNVKSHIKLIHRILIKYPFILFDLNLFKKSKIFHLNNKIKNIVSDIYDIDFITFSYSKDQ